MRILLLNQTFHPDVVATAQYLTQLAVALAEEGHRVTVVASRRGYDAQEQLFPQHETWRDVEIHRIRSSRFGKSSKTRRAVDFATFMLSCAGRAFTLPRHDVVVALTSPPLISLLGAVLARLRGSRFIYWIMDLNPDEAVAAGWVRQNSLAARALEALSRFSLRCATRIIVLDRFVKERIRSKGIDAEKIAVIPTWSLDDAVQYDAAGRKAFRKQHGLEGKFVVMYSGNHSPCHPLDTLLEAARALAADSRIRFLFVGGGSGFGQHPVLALPTDRAPVRVLVGGGHARGRHGSTLRGHYSSLQDLQQSPNPGRSRQFSHGFAGPARPYGVG
jgi:colanic acid biosynthesis glycosyl transferase WcaI